MFADEFVYLVQYYYNTLSLFVYGFYEGPVDLVGRPSGKWYPLLAELFCEICKDSILRVGDFTVYVRGGNWIKVVPSLDRVEQELT